MHFAHRINLCSFAQLATPLPPSASISGKRLDSEKREAEDRVLVYFSSWLPVLAYILTALAAISVGIDQNICSLTSSRYELA